MISIEVLKDQDKIEHISISGHSGYAEMGYDIVCAAISALTVTVANSITEIVGYKELKASVSYGQAEFDLKDIDKKQKDIILLIRTLLLGLEEIALSYPEYVEFIEIQKGE